LGRYTYPLYDFQPDRFRRIPPSLLERLAIGGAAREVVKEGADNGRIAAVLDATWMMARMLLELERPVEGGDVLELDVTHSVCQRGCFYRQVRFFRAGEAIARCLLGFMPVHRESRRILRPEEVLKLRPADFVPQPVEVPTFSRLHIREELEDLCQLTVRGWDCDFNGHMTAARYLDFVCEAAGFWAGEERLLRSVQLEYCAECRPGQRLSIQGKQTPGGLLLRGVHMNGTTAFLARCNLCNLRLDRDMGQEYNSEK